MGRTAGPARSAATADTFVLHFADFEGAGGPDAMGYTTVDRTAQIARFFHVADGTELDGGQYGNLLPLNGLHSMWCGVDASTAAPYCGYATLPGYGNLWDQILESSVIAGDSLEFSYNIFWDSEPGYDGTVVEYTFDSGVTWTSFPVNDSFSYRSGLYDNKGPTPFLAETFTASSSGASSVQVRFRFTSDGSYSDADALWQTDGALIVDDIAVSAWSGGSPVFSDTEDFESANPDDNGAGIWTGRKGPAFGDFAALYPGVSLLQEDECDFVGGFVWGFFDDPINAYYECHTPDPRPDVGVIPYGNEDGVYIRNEIWSPPFDNIGSGDEYRFGYRRYLDNSLNALVFWTGAVRSWVDPDGGGPLPLCPGQWRETSFFIWYWQNRVWSRTTYQIGSLIDPNAEKIQIAVGVLDMCKTWCNIYGTGSCHSHAPLFDDIRVERVSTTGPRFSVRHIDLFQDNFAGDGTLTGTARADMAADILPSASPGIQPGDSCVMYVSPIGSSSGAPAAWVYVRVHNGNAPKSGAGLGSPDTRAGKTGPRWPYVGSWNDADGHIWEVFQMDTAFTSTGVVVNDRYCVDLNDDLFVPGDTILYFFGADRDGTPYSGNESYWYRTIDGQGSDQLTDDPNEAAASPCEFTILPAGGYTRGGDMLYVDDTDDRGGPAQLFFDSAFDMMVLRDVIDRFDVLGPSSAVGNSLASRVTNNVTQIIDVYKTIIWNSGNLSSATIGDGTGWQEKSDDFGLLYEWIDTSSEGIGLYISGDGVASEWFHRLGGTGAMQLRSDYINFNLVSDDHVAFGEPVSPLLTATGASFIHHGVPDQLIALGGCPLINRFDVLEPIGSAIIEFPYPNSGYGAVISQQTINSVGETAVVVLSGFSYHYIRDSHLGWPVARVEHLSDILRKLPYILPQPTGVDPTIEFVNALEPNYPNPFNPVTTIRYSIKERAHVSLKVYNAAGQLVTTLVDEVQSPEQVSPVTWHGLNNAGQSVSSGVYFYKFVTKDFAKTRKMVVLK
jgi:hypothetical protein